MQHIDQPSGLVGINGKQPIAPVDILPYLPAAACFFDSKRWNWGGLDTSLPWAVTTRICTNSQQYLKIEQTMDKDKKIGVWTDADGTRYNVRKLTERECFRFMGLRDAEVDTIKSAGLSATAQYKLAGNSIVVNVLADAIFECLLYPTAEDGTLF